MIPAQREVPAKYHGGERTMTTHVVWHATAGGTANSSLGWLNRPTARTDGRGVASYNAMIERDGSIIYHVPFNLTAYHAGKSNWPQPNGPSMNHRSLGFAFCNLQRAPGKAGFERITDAQIESAVWLWQRVAQQYHGISEHVRHRDVAPTRRNDPTPETLDWPAFLARLEAAV